MKYDFNQICDRKNTSCIKWDFVQYIFGHDDVIPMWVADMDFPVAPPIVEALKRRVEHEFYGYTTASAGVIQAVVDRMWDKYAWKIKPEWIVLRMIPGLKLHLLMAGRVFIQPAMQVKDAALPIMSERF